MKQECCEPPQIKVTIDKSLLDLWKATIRRNHNMAIKISLQVKSSSPKENNHTAEENDNTSLQIMK